MTDKIRIIVKKIFLIAFLLTTIVVMGYASFFLVIICGGIHSFILPVSLYRIFHDPRLYTLLVLLGLSLFFLKRQKFIPSTIMAFIFPVLSPIVFVWLEFHLFKQKKWLWFGYVMISYVVLLWSGYYWFKNVIIYAT